MRRFIEPAIFAIVGYFAGWAWQNYGATPEPQQHESVWDDKTREILRAKRYEFMQYMYTHTDTPTVITFPKVEEPSPELWSFTKHSFLDNEKRVWEWISKDPYAQLNSTAIVTNIGSSATSISMPSAVTAYCVNWNH